MNNKRHHGTRKVLLAACAAFALTPAAAWAQPPERSRYDIAAQDLGTALTELARQSNREIYFPADLTRGKRAPRLRGNLTFEDALSRLLANSGLRYRVNASGSIVVEAADAASLAAGGAETASSSLGSEAGSAVADDSAEITVTGTRIRGGVTPSPVIVISSEQIREEGFTDLGDVIRNVSQNFSGGQNPGIVGGATGGGINNQNITGGSGVNLRGLGQDASLTLLNGRRLSYGGYVQMVDISAIPVEAVDRIEIVADGASAIYGSDAVGGVANVILKPDFKGLAVGARYGGATDGGLTTNEYTATTGAKWSSGGLIATFKMASNDPVYSDQRDYTIDMNDPTIIWQGNDLYSGLISAHQSLGSFIEFHLDMLMSKREFFTETSYPPNYFRSTPETEAYLASPSIEFLVDEWRVSIGAAIGNEKTDTDSYTMRIVDDSIVSSAIVSYTNKSEVYEIGAEGPLFHLASGAIRLAFGAGYRNNGFLFKNETSNRTDAGGDEGSRFAYGELYLPLIGPSQNIPGVYRFSLTGAVRAEDYDSFGRVATPKVGLIYSPNSAFTLKASWGRSFKAPTLLQRFQTRNAYLYPTTTFGGAGYAPGATVLYLAGGSPDLGPERARTWSTSLAFHPESLPGLQAELTLFDIDYTDRVVQPLAPSQALSNDIYAGFIDYDPTAGEQAEVIAESNFFYNYAGASYDATNVVAILRNRYVNASRQRVKGVDLSGSYRFDLGKGRATVRGSISWLDSDQATTSTQSAYDMAGTLFYPAKLNSRIGAIYNHGGFTGAFFGNYKSGVRNTVDGTKGSSFLTFDATLRYDISESPNVLSGLSFELSARNLFDQAPPLYTTTVVTNAPYDSTNYSAIGRFLSLSISKHW